MILDKQESELFFEVFDALTDYANGKWGITAAIVDSRSGFVNERNQRMVAAEVWRNKQIIEDLIADDLPVMPSDALRVLRSWKSAFTDIFFVVQTAPRTIYFVNDDAAFSVVGASREIVSMLSTVPCMVTATLLPFGEHVVLAAYLDEASLFSGESIRGLADRVLQKAIEGERVIASGPQLEAAAQELEDARISREAKRMLDSLNPSDDGKDDSSHSHRGMLSGLSLADREEQVRQHAYVYGNAQRAMVELRSYCERGPIRRSLSDLLMGHTKADLLEMAASLQINRISSKPKRDIIALIAEVALDPQVTERLVATLDPDDFDCLKKLYDAGGFMCVDAEKMRRAEDFLPPIPLFNYTFLDDRKFVFVMPDEILASCKHIDWDAVLETQAQLRLAISTANLLVEMRGALLFSEMYDQYRQLSGAPLDDGSTLMGITFGPHGDLALYDVWYGEGIEDTYLVHSDIASSFDYPMSGHGHGNARQRIHQGSIPAEIEDLFAVQEDKRPRPISEEMASVGEYVPWARTRPSAVALRAYLDEHVPNGADDYTYADEVVDDLIVMGTCEFPLPTISGYLSSKLTVSGIDQLVRVTELVSNLYNALPKWSNNGWSANELNEGAGRGRVFYNDDGSVKRVGPFDACPCGSGKIYKDCHGKQ